jgi:hypothetical protein
VEGRESPAGAATGVSGEMSMAASGQAVVSLARFVSMAEPFCHVRVMNPLPVEMADELLAWLDRVAPWKRRVASSFDQFECNLCQCGLPASLADLIAPATLRAVRADMERLFDVQLGDVYSVVAHRLVGGQGIGIHNDEPAGGRETHRLIIQLGGLPSEDCGGQFLLLSAADMDHLHAAFRPIHNTAIGLELSSRSYHAVADLRAGVRYALVYSLWRAELEQIAEEPGIHPGHAGTTSASPAALAPHARRGHDLEALLDLLAPGHRSTPSQGALLAHLVHTYEILRRWDSPAHVCLAGLFHELYGAEMFPAATTALQAREQVGRAIGDQAENLAWLFGALTRRSLVHAWAESRPGGKAARYCLRHCGELVEVDAGVLAELACIDAASMVEQVSRPARGGHADSSRAEHAILLMPWLPQAARIELAQACGLPEAAQDSMLYEASHA